VVYKITTGLGRIKNTRKPVLTIPPSTPGFRISVMIVPERRDTLLLDSGKLQVSTSVAFISKAGSGRSIHVGSLVAHSFLLSGAPTGGRYRYRSAGGETETDGRTDRPGPHKWLPVTDVSLCS